MKLFFSSYFGLFRLRPPNIYKNKLKTIQNCKTSNSKSEDHIEKRLLNVR